MSERLGEAGGQGHAQSLRRDPGRLRRGRGLAGDGPVQSGVVCKSDRAVLQEGPAGAALGAADELLAVELDLVAGRAREAQLEAVGAGLGAAAPCGQARQLEAAD